MTVFPAHLETLLVRDLRTPVAITPLGVQMFLRFSLHPGRKASA